MAIYPETTLCLVKHPDGIACCEDVYGHDGPHYGFDGDIRKHVWRAT